MVEDKGRIGNLELEELSLNAQYNGNSKLNLGSRNSLST